MGKFFKKKKKNFKNTLMKSLIKLNNVALTFIRYLGLQNLELVGDMGRWERLVSDLLLFLGIIMVCSCRLIRRIRQRRLSQFMGLRMLVMPRKGLGLCGRIWNLKFFLQIISIKKKITFFFQM